MTEQEMREADQLCLAWEQVNAMAKSLTGLSPEAEEILAICYNHITDKTSVVKGNLQGVTLAVDQITIELRRWSDNLLVHDYRETRLPRSTPPAWYQRSRSALDNKLDQIALKREGSYHLINLLVNSVESVLPQQVKDALKFFQANSQQLVDLENNMRDTIRETRALMAKKTAEFASVRSAIFDALCAWASASEARVEYLRSKGIAVVKLGIQCVDNHQTNSKPAQSLHRQKKEIAVENNAPQKKEEKVQAEQSWTVSCFNHMGSVIAEFPLLMSDNGDELAEILDKNYGWQPSGAKTIQVLLTLINQTPAERNMGTCIRFRDINWYRLKLEKKWRMMVYIKEETRTISLMAGHRLRLYTSIGKSKNEA